MRNVENESGEKTEPQEFMLYPKTVGNVCFYVYICVWVSIYAYLCVKRFMCVFVCPMCMGEYTCMSICMCVRVCVPMCTYVCGEYIYLYLYISLCISHADLAGLASQ